MPDYKLSDEWIEDIHALRDGVEAIWRALGLIASQACDAAREVNASLPRRERIPLAAVDKAIANEVGLTSATIRSYRTFFKNYEDELAEFPQLTYSQLRLAVQEANQNDEPVSAVLLRCLGASADGFSFEPPDLWAARLRRPRVPTWQEYVQRALVALTSAMKDCDDEKALETLADAWTGLEALSV